MEKPIDPSILKEHDIREHFKVQLKKCSVPAVCGRSYVRIEALRKWMLELSPIENGARNVDFLLETCWQKDHVGNQDHTKFQAPASLVIDGPRKCLDVFAILLEIDRGHLIEKFHEFGVVDSKLPLDLAALENILERAKLYDEVAREFNRAQWKYRPLMFNIDDWLDEPGNRIIPICEKELIKKGGTAEVHKILVQEDFISPELKSIIKSSFWNDRIFGRCYIMALKTYKSNNKRLYDNEIDAFRGLHQNAGMIKCLLTYSHLELDSFDNGSDSWTTEVSGDTTHNILLVKGEWDLETFFKTYGPPALMEEVSGFWSSVFLLAKAVKDIHKFETRNANLAELYYGCHADIKPDNILMVGEDFKLADPGFARFRRQTNSIYDQKQEIEFSGGTKTFGAPECHLNPKHHEKPTMPIKITPAIDIWSLGCVFSIVATWVVIGQQGVATFAELRRQGIDEARAANRAAAMTSDSVESGQDDFFHDGIKVLPHVLEWHRTLRGAVRKSDTITEKILDLVETRMLLSSVADRISAAALSKELDEIRYQQSRIEPSTESQAIRDIIGRQEFLNKKDMQEQSERDEQLKQNLIEAEQHLLKATPSQHESASSSAGEHLIEALRHVRSAKETVTAEQTIEPGSISSTGVFNRQVSKVYPRSIRTTHRSSVVNPSKHSPPFSPLREVVEDEQLLQHASPEAREGNGYLKQPQSPSYSIALARPTRKARAYTTGDTNTGNSNNSGLRHRFNSLVARAKSTIRPKKPNERLEKFFFERDLAFIVDNGETMLPFWEDAKILLSRLVRLAQNVDKDGMDLHFTCGETKFAATNDTTAFARAMDNPHHKPVEDVSTDMSDILGRLLNEYLRLFEAAETSRFAANKTKKLTIIVLTDGLWRRMKNPIAVDNQIVLFSEKLKKLRGNLVEGDRRVSIQFVQFGTDQEASHRLARLDDKLIFRGVSDIVDTKPSDADLYKILLGSLDPNIDDEDNANAQSPDVSPAGTNPFLDNAISLDRTRSPDQIPFTHVHTPDVEYDRLL